MNNASPSEWKRMEPSTTAGIADTQAASPRITEEAIAWMQEKRGISRETLASLGVGSSTALFPNVGERLPAIYFKYGEHWKARSFPDKNFVTSKGFIGQFWNLESVLHYNSQEVFIVEGELDALSLVEAGVPLDRVLSIPNGAKQEPSADPHSQRGYVYVLDALSKGLNRAKKIVWCGDTDSPGLALRTDMVALFGAAKFYFVEWPDGYKDANDVLLGEGAAFLLDWVCNHKPWPVDGVYRINELPEPPPLTLWDPGFPEWESKVKLSPSLISVVTGQPNHGKTTLFQQIWYQVVKRYDLVACMATFETRAKPHVRRQLRTLICGKKEYDLSDEEKKKADDWISEHYVFLEHPDRTPTLEWFLDRATVAVVRYGAKIIQLDPWNRLEGARGRNESETDYIARCIRALSNFALEFSCHVQIVAHPAKMDGIRRNTPPSLEDISGCYSDDTEVLTRRGWLLHKDVTTDDWVACFDLAEQTMRWEMPSQIWQYKYKGPMNRHKYCGGDLLVTPNHRMVIKPQWDAPKASRPRGGPPVKYSHGFWQFIPSENLFGGKWFVPQSALWSDDSQISSETVALDKGYESSAFWEYVGWWIAEGCIVSGGLDICQSEGASADKIKRLISALGFDGTHSRQRPTGKGKKSIWRFRVKARSHPSLAGWFGANCGAGAQNKKIPDEAWGLSRRLKRLLFDGLMAGDGHAHRAGWSYSTISPRLADDVQRLAIELGYTAQKRTLPLSPIRQHRQGFQVNINARSQSSLHPYRNSTRVDYDGVVWCLTVPTGAYVTRRNGWASICGNSKHWENMVDQGFVVHRPEIFDGVNRKTEANLYHRKARFEELGYPCKLALDYKLDTNRYVSADYKIGCE